jgi:hypothetical protein
MNTVEQFLQLPFRNINKTTLGNMSSDFFYLAPTTRLPKREEGSRVEFQLAPNFLKGVLYMKKKIALLALILCIASTLTAFSRGNNHGQYGDYNNGDNGYQNRPYFHKDYDRYRGGRYHDDGLELAIGIAGGLLLGSELRYSATRPPRQTVIYGAPYITKQPQVIVKQPTICVEERITKGQSLTNQNDGSRVWSSSRYPTIQRVEVPCN